MPKYYCKNGDFQIILDAIDTETAIRKMLSHIMYEEQGCMFLSLISEKGFSFNGAKPISMIPFMKEMDMDLPPDDILIQEICKSMGIDPRIISKQTIDWLLYGQGKEGE